MLLLCLLLDLWFEFVLLFAVALFVVLCVGMLAFRMCLSSLDWLTVVIARCVVWLD